MTSSPIINTLLGRANQLKFKYLFFLVAGLFLTDILVPDYIPMIDEIILGVLAIILANWKKERARQDTGRLIDGEVVEKNEEK